MSRGIFTRTVSPGDHCALNLEQAIAVRRPVGLPVHRRLESFRPGGNTQHERETHRLFHRHFNFEVTCFWVVAANMKSDAPAVVAGSVVQRVRARDVLKQGRFALQRAGA